MLLINAKPPQQETVEKEEEILPETPQVPENNLPEEN